VVKTAFAEYNHDNMATHDDAFPAPVEFEILERRYTPEGIVTYGVMDDEVVELPPIGTTTLLEVTRSLLEEDRTGEIHE
jgi:hypothetical protein